MITLKDFITITDEETPVTIYYDPPTPYRNLRTKKLSDLKVSEIREILDCEVTLMMVSDGGLTIYLGDMEYD